MNFCGLRCIFNVNTKAQNENNLAKKDKLTNTKNKDIKGSSSLYEVCYGYLFLSDQNFFIKLFLHKFFPLKILNCKVLTNKFCACAAKRI